jgi:phosphinothricin acetyltransferase
MAIDVIPLGAEHWDRVRAIYLEGLATGQASFEVRAPDWVEWDANHLRHSRLVAVTTADSRSGRRQAATSPQAAFDGRADEVPGIVGWVALARVSSRQCYTGVAEVSVYVAGEAWGRGVGARLLNEAVRTSEAAGIWTLQASIFPENSRSVRLHSACGFRIVGWRERIAQRRGAWHDTVLMERRSRVVGRESW